MAVRVRVKGRLMLKRRTARAIAQVNAGIEAAVEESVDAMADDARTNAPRDPTTVGRLADSIEGHASGTSGQVAVYGEAATYAEYPEFGTSEQDAQPYMGPAAEAERTRLEHRVRTHVQAHLRRGVR